MSNKALALNTWAGTRYYPVEVVGETRTRLRCRLLLSHGINLPGRRSVHPNEHFLVPKDAVRDVSEGDPRLEDAPYFGAIYGYGGSVDAQRPTMTCAHCGRSWRAVSRSDECHNCGSRDKLASPATPVEEQPGSPGRV